MKCRLFLYLTYLSKSLLVDIGSANLVRACKKNGLNLEFGVQHGKVSCANVFISLMLFNSFSSFYCVCFYFTLETKV